jgi:hypothetical protein
MVTGRNSGVSRNDFHAAASTSNGNEFGTQNLKLIKKPSLTVATIASFR